MARIIGPQPDTTSAITVGGSEGNRYLGLFLTIDDCHKGGGKIIVEPDSGLDSPGLALEVSAPRSSEQLV